MAKCYGTKSVKGAQLQNERKPYVESKDFEGKKEKEWSGMKQIPNEAKGRTKERKNGKSEEHGKTNGFAFHGVTEFQAEERKHLRAAMIQTTILV